MREPTLHSFEDEHEEIQEQLSVCERWVERLPIDDAVEQRATMNQTVEFLLQYLPPRMAWEESELYPLADGAGAGGVRLTSTLRTEHAIIGRWLSQLAALAGAAAPDTGAFHQLALKLFGLLQAHFEGEEALLMPVLQRMAGAARPAGAPSPH